MAAKKSASQNVMTEALGGDLFRATQFNAPAVEHQFLPISYVATDAGPDEFDLGVENETVSIDATAGDCDALLPPASGIDGKKYTIKNRKGVNVVTVLPSGSDSIDDQSSIVLANMGDAITVQALDNDVETGWIIISCVTGLS